jgi:REP element-mobilizing transposase RayT
MWQSITYRLADALPVAVVRRLAEELGLTTAREDRPRPQAKVSIEVDADDPCGGGNDAVSARAGRPRPQGKALSPEDGDEERRRAYRKKVEAWLDSGHGACILREPRVAAMVQENLLHHAGSRYHLGAWVVMPNHVHVLIRVQETWPLERIVHGWKSFTGKRIKDLLGIPAPIWQGEYWDRYIRDEAHWQKTRLYIEENPVAARLVSTPTDWVWSSASW